MPPFWKSTYNTNLVNLFGIKTLENDNGKRCFDDNGTEDLGALKRTRIDGKRDGKVVPNAFRTTSASRAMSPGDGADHHKALTLPALSTTTTTAPTTTQPSLRFEGMTLVPPRRARMTPSRRDGRRHCLQAGHFPRPTMTTTTTTALATSTTTAPLGDTALSLELPRFGKSPRPSRPETTLDFDSIHWF